MVRDKSPPHDCLHFIPSINLSFIIPMPTCDHLIPPNKGIICKLDYSKFNLFLFRVMMTIKHWLHFSFPFKVSIRIGFTLERRDLHFDTTKIVVYPVIPLPRSSPFLYSSFSSESPRSLASSSQPAPKSFPCVLRQSPLACCLGNCWGCLCSNSINLCHLSSDCSLAYSHSKISSRISWTI